jgi:hypothetical protein
MLKDMPDSVRLKFLQEGKITIQEYRDAAAMARVVTQGQQSLALEAARQKGRVTLQDLNAMSAQDLEEIRQDNRIVIEGVRSAAQRDAIIQRAQEARKTKAAPSGSDASKYPTQDRVKQQNEVAKIINQHPEWTNMITFDERGFPQIAIEQVPDNATYMEILRALGQAPEPPPTPPAPPPPAGYGATPAPTKPMIPPTGNPGGVPMTGAGNTVNQSPLGGSAAPIAPTAPVQAAPVQRGAAPGTVLMITPDGKGTRSVPADQVEVAKRQGFKPTGGR